MMVNEVKNDQTDENPYTREEYEKDLVHCDVVLAYQKELTNKLGRPVTFGEAEYVAYGWEGTTASRTEELRQKYASHNNKD